MTMTTFVQLIEPLVAAMMSLIPPGYSMYSQIPILHCDEACQTTRLCEDQSRWQCEPPRLNRQKHGSLAMEIYESSAGTEGAP